MGDVTSIESSGGGGGPLSGIVVADFSRVVTGPLCSRLLADQGATVVKIEPAEGDMTRPADPVVDGHGTYFAHLNAGKQGIVLDLKDPDHLADAHELVARADVLLENFRPGVMARWGLGADTLLERHPRLVYCSISGYGQDGPWADRRCFAPVVHGESGMLATSSRLSGRSITPEPHSHADVQAGMLAMGAISAALFDRERTGRGTHLDVSLIEASLYANEFAAPELAGQSGDTHYGGSSCLVVRTADGTYVTTQGNPASHFRKWVVAMGREDLLDDPRFKHHAVRLEHRDEIDRLVLDWVAQVPDYPTLERLLSPTTLATGVVRTISELAETDWARERNVFAEPHPGVRVPAVPYRSSARPVGVAGPPPRHGEHTEQVRRSLRSGNARTDDDGAR